MGDLLADLLNDRIQPVNTCGQVNGVMDYGVSDDERDDISEYLSDRDEEFEREEFIRKEFNSYFGGRQDMSDGLTDIDDGTTESLAGTDLIDLIHVPRVFDVYKFDTYYKNPLPIDSFKSKILDMINTNSVSIIHGATGCGKTTQVPQYILDQCKENKTPCNIVVTQPRKIAAINISQRVCEERGWAMGTVCGYQVGLDKTTNEDVILTYVTTEVLLQKLIGQRNLNKHTHIIIDEVHERNKALDFLLLIVRKYLFTNSPSVKIILMSATMEAEEYAYYFRSISRSNPDNYLQAPILYVDKKSEFTTNLYYIEQFSPNSLTNLDFNIDDPCITPQQYNLCLALIKLFDQFDAKGENEENERIGSALVFLPGLHEIEEMNKILLAKKDSLIDWEIIPLHSSLTREHMIKAFERPKPKTRKIILSTNIAESSVTVPDVKYVVDFCLTKIMTMNETTKFATLSLQWASKNNCIQRAGRVGRVSDGRVYRILPCQFYEQQIQDNTIPEIQRAPLESIVLYVKLLDLNDTPKNILALAISPPNLRDVETCIWRLKEVGALLQTCRGHKTAADGDLTFLGRVMGLLPLDITLSKLIILGHMFSCLEETVIMAAGAMTKNVFVQSLYDRFKCYRKKLVWADGSCSDLMIMLNLFNVWLSKKREGSFSTPNAEYAWCKTNFVNLRGLREWELLIKEINSRLKNLHIEKAVGPERVPITALEKPTLLKVIICGAFYPNYYIRSSDFGQVDSLEAVKVVNGRDPNNTVYFTNMRTNQPGHIYTRQIKEMLKCDSDNVQIGFDQQTSKVFVEFKDVKRPESITVDGQQLITTIPGSISVGVYEAVRKRQLNMYFSLRILSDHKAWDFAKSTEEKHRLQNAEEEELHCYSTVKYSPLPSLDIEYVTVSVTHIVDAGHFYCENWNDESKQLQNAIFTALNAPGVFLDPLGPDDKIELNGKKYAARFNSDGKFYRCKVLHLTPGKPATAHVQFLDYGNTQKVPANYLYRLPAESAECHIDPIAMCCVLSEVQPHLVLNPKGLWSERVNEIFKKKSERVLLNAKVYSVVDDIVHVELFPEKAGAKLSFNQWLINEGHGQKCEESQRSKMDHELRQKILSSEDPNNMSLKYQQQLSTKHNYTDFEAPPAHEVAEIIQLKGPFSPLEMRIYGLVEASLGTTVRVDGDSVNAVLLDENPEDPHTRLLVAGSVSQTSSGQVVKLSLTTVMPNIPGFPMLVSLLFCPLMEPKLTPDGSRIASILCGLGSRELSDKPNFPAHDFSLVTDTELDAQIILRINQVRFYMNRAIKCMQRMHEGLASSVELFNYQKELKQQLLNLLHMRRKSVDRVDVKYANMWNKSAYGDIEVMKVEGKPEEEDDIWRLLWFVQLNEENKAKLDINKNLAELMEIAKRLSPEKEIVCQLCKSAVMKNVQDVRLHLFKNEHQKNLAIFNGDD